MLPLSTVESHDQCFRRLSGGLSSTQVPDRKTLTLHLDRVFEVMEQKVKAALEGTDAVSTCNGQPITGVTLGWLFTGLIPLF